MPDPNTTYQEHLEMFGSDEEKEKYKKQLAIWDEWLKDIPVYEPKFPIGRMHPKESKE